MQWEPALRELQQEKEELEHGRRLPTLLLLLLLQLQQLLESELAV